MALSFHIPVLFCYGTGTRFGGSAHFRPQYGRRKQHLSAGMVTGTVPNRLTATYMLNKGFSVYDETITRQPLGLRATPRGQLYAPPPQRLVG